MVFVNGFAANAIKKQRDGDAKGRDERPRPMTHRHLLWWLG
jgi:hypothetical protein